MNNPQRFVATALILVLALEFGSFTKFQKVWSLAFSAQPSSSSGNDQGTTLLDLLKSPNNLNPPATNNYGNGKGWVNPNPDGSCPSGTHAIHVSGGKLVCQFDSSTTTPTPAAKCPPGTTPLLGFCIPNWMIGLPQIAP